MSKCKIPELEKRLNEPLENFLKRRYLQENVGCILIARELGIDKSVVLRYLNCYGIERNKSMHNGKIRLQEDLQKKFGDPKEYVKKNLDQGRWLTDIATEFGISAHTLSFWCKDWDIGFSKEHPHNLYQLQQQYDGKLKEFLVNEYIEKRRSVRDIGKELGIPWDGLRAYLKYFEIPIRDIQAGNEARSRVVQVGEFTGEEKQVLYGSLLGDGSVTCHVRNGKIRGNAWFSESHGLKQKDYLKWKAEKLKRFECLGSGLYENKKSIIFKTTHLEIFTKLRREFYSKDGKVVTEEILNKLDPLGLAVWFQDDGWYNYSNKSIGLATCGFTYEEQLLIRKYFEEKWNIKINIHNRICCSQFKNGKSSHYVLYFPVAEAKRFIELIKPHIHPTLRYKIGEGKGVGLKGRKPKIIE